MFGKKKLEEKIQQLETDLVEVKLSAVEETVESTSNTAYLFHTALKKSLLNLEFCFDLSAEEHKFLNEFIRKMPFFVKSSIFTKQGLESTIDPVPSIGLSKGQLEYFASEYDLRISAHDSKDHLLSIQEGDIDSTVALFGKIVQRHIGQNSSDKVSAHCDMRTQAINSYTAFEEFIDQAAVDSSNRFAIIEGGSLIDRQVLVERYLSKTSKQCGSLKGKCREGNSTTKLQPVDMMRELIDDEIIFIENPNKIENLADLIVDIRNAEEHVLVVFMDSFDIDADALRFLISKEDEGVFETLRY